MTGPGDPCPPATQPSRWMVGAPSVNCPHHTTALAYLGNCWTVAPSVWRTRMDRKLEMPLGQLTARAWKRPSIQTHLELSTLLGGCLQHGAQNTKTLN